MLLVAVLAIYKAGGIGTTVLTCIWRTASIAISALLPDTPPWPATRDPAGVNGGDRSM